MNRASLAFAMIGHEVASIGGGLIDISLGGVALALQLDHDYGIGHEQYGVCPSGLQGQAVLEDRRVLLGPRFDI
jgi:hypothetical protein